MKHYPHPPLVYPHLSSNLKFVLILLAALLGAAILAGLSGKPPSAIDIATEKATPPALNGGAG